MILRYKTFQRPNDPYSITHINMCYISYLAHRSYLLCTPFLCFLLSWAPAQKQQLNPVMMELIHARSHIDPFTSFHHSFYWNINNKQQCREGQHLTFSGKTKGRWQCILSSSLCKTWNIKTNSIIAFICWLYNQNKDYMQNSHALYNPTHSDRWIEILHIVNQTMWTNLMRAFSPK